MRCFDDTIVLVQVDRRDGNFVRSQFQRVVEEGAVAFPLQFRIGNNSDFSIRARTIDADDLALSVLDPDEAEFRIGRLGVEFRDQSGEQAFAPGCLGDVIDRPFRRASTIPWAAAEARKLATSARAPRTWD